MPTALKDVTAITQDLLRFPTITPANGAIFDYLTQHLEGLGFQCHQEIYGEAPAGPVTNFFARLGTQRPHLCFAGHVDVVPTGAENSWSSPPFAAEIINNHLVGRGAVDMKGAIGCFLAALTDYLSNSACPGSISLLITGDEEGPATYGTQAMLPWLEANNHIFDACIIGEPTSVQHVGDMAKIGRRGSLSGHITVQGTQGHVAYPHLADNPIPRLARFLHALNDHVWDQGDDTFQASNLEITAIGPQDNVGNVIPAQAEARFNIRYTPHHSAASLQAIIEQYAQGHAGAYEITYRHSAIPFLSEPSRLHELTADAVAAITGHGPSLSTSGGTSDARFLHKLGPVIELGLCNRLAHKVNEAVSLADLHTLEAIYREILQRFFS